MRDVDEDGKKVRQEDRRNKGAHSFRAIVKPERLIVVSQYFLFKGVRLNQMVDCCVSIDSESATDGNNGRKGEKDIGSCHPQKNSRGKVQTSNLNFVEGHGGSRATKGERRKPAPGRCRGGWVSSIRTSLIAYQTPSQTEHTWRKSKDKKTSKHISERDRTERDRARMYVEQGNETLRTKNKSKRTSVTIYHDVDAKSEVRDCKRLTLYNKNIASARPDIWEARGKYEGGSAPNTSNDRTLTHPKSGFSKRETATMCGDRNSRHGSNRSRRLDSSHDDEIEMTTNAKRIISQADRGLALTKDVKISNLQRSYGILCNHIIGSATNNVAHGGALSPDTDDASAKHFRTSSKQPK